MYVFILAKVMMSINSKRHINSQTPYSFPKPTPLVFKVKNGFPRFGKYSVVEFIEYFWVYSYKIIENLIVSILISK